MTTKNIKNEKDSSIQKNKYEKDLDKLIELGINLQSWYADSYKDSNSSVPKIEYWNKFFSKYQVWYSEAVTLIKICLPERLNDFKKLYERQTKRKEINVENYVIEDALEGLTSSRAGQLKCGPTNAYSKFQMQLTILLAVKQFLKVLYFL